MYAGCLRSVEAPGAAQPAWTARNVLGPFSLARNSLWMSWRLAVWSRLAEPRSDAGSAVTFGGRSTRRRHAWRGSLDGPNDPRPPIESGRRCDERRHPGRWDKVERQE